jgi:hypothetical protein
MKGYEKSFDLLLKKIFRGPTNISSPLVPLHCAINTHSPPLYLPTMDTYHQEMIQFFKDWSRTGYENRIVKENENLCVAWRPLMFGRGVYLHIKDENKLAKFVEYLKKKHVSDCGEDGEDEEFYFHGAVDREITVAGGITLALEESGIIAIDNCMRGCSMVPTTDPEVFNEKESAFWDCKGLDFVLREGVAMMYQVDKVLRRIEAETETEGQQETK